MKKQIFLYSFLILGLFFFTGCNQNETGPIKTLTCESHLTQGEVKLNLNYVVTYRGDYVKTIKTTNILTSDNKKVLEGYKESVENLYAKYKNIDYYDFQINLEDKTLTSVITIDYDHVDTKKLVALENADEQLIKNGKVNIADIRKIYEESGATCEISN